MERGKRNPHVADASIQPEPAWVKPSEVSVEHVQFPLDRGAAIVGRLSFDAHDQLIDFALMLLATVEDEDPIEVARVDCAHGTVHVHVGTRKQQMRDIRNAADVATGYDEAWDRLLALAESSLMDSWA